MFTNSLVHHLSNRKTFRNITEKWNVILCMGPYSHLTNISIFSNRRIYIYIYIYMCVCVCVCIKLFSNAREATKLLVITSVYSTNWKHQHDFWAYLMRLVVHGSLMCSWVNSKQIPTDRSFIPTCGLADLILYEAYLCVYNFLGTRDSVVIKVLWYEPEDHGL
jgi:hypothetical protein